MRRCGRSLSSLRGPEKTGFDTIDELIDQIEEYWDADEAGLSFETLRSHERMGIIHGHGGRHGQDRFVAEMAGVAERPEEWADQRFLFGVGQIGSDGAQCAGRVFARKWCWRNPSD